MTFVSTLMFFSLPRTKQMESSHFYLFLSLLEVWTIGNISSTCIDGSLKRSRFNDSAPIFPLSFFKFLLYFDERFFNIREKKWRKYEQICKSFCIINYIHLIHWKVKTWRETWSLKMSKVYSKVRSSSFGRFNIALGVGTRERKKRWRRCLH